MGGIAILRTMVRPMVRRLTLTQLDITPTENSVMKHLTLFLLCFATISGFAQQDIVVNGSGLPGTYSTISAAVQAANPGDKILVSNQAFPYQEDTLFIDKDVTIMPYSASSHVAFEGDIRLPLIPFRISPSLVLIRISR